MAIYEYNDQNISDTQALRTELTNAGETIAVYTVIGGYVCIEANILTQEQTDAAVAAAND